ncbi:MAG: hypothetical protein OEW06_03490 [Gemmatimonadota bacterium]|nr:hypothetical protein [Gemmatimonadota bacterium]
MILTVFGGAMGGATLYSGLRQPLALLEDPSATDTLDLGRRLAPAISFGASATYFPSPHLGLSGEIVFMGFGLDDTCSMVYTDPSTLRRGYNEQMCNDIAGKSGSASTIAFYVGGLYRIAPRGGIKPYLRVQAGITTRASSTVELSGRFLDETGVVRDRLVIGDPDASSLDPSVGFGLGFMLPIAAGYQVRLEFRDHLLYANRVTGPADALERAPTERTLVNSLGLVLMLDIVLEQKRGRRY